VAIVRPFRGLRPRPEYAREVATPPYDVLNTREAREMAKNNPNSFLRVDKAELEFDDNTDPYSEQVYRRGKENLARLCDRGIMVRDEKPMFYLYRLTMDGRSQTGLMTLTSVDEYDSGIIKKHEHTRPEKVTDRANHISYLEAQVGPVFTTFRQNSRIDDIFQKVTAQAPVTDFVAADGIRHELWTVGDPRTMDEIIAAFREVPEMYIADGHHRSASASEVCRRFRGKKPGYTGNESYNFFLNVLFPDDQLRILPYNRVVKDLNGLTRDQFLKKISDKFEIVPHNGEVNPNEPHTFGVYCESQWYVLRAKPGTFDETSPTGSIDASILGENLIGPVLGITNPKTDKRIDFVGGIRGTKELVKLVDSGEYKIAFSLYPTSIAQLLKVADAGEVMPPKSTWFEPKLRSGMVVNLLTD
jgi:uncharacterized protein (DUF1015 family)